MRSFAGRDILSLKDSAGTSFSGSSRSPTTCARRPRPANTDLLKNKDAPDAFLPAEHPDPALPRGRHASPRRAGAGLLRLEDDPRRDFYQESIKDTFTCWSTTRT